MSPLLSTGRTHTKMEHAEEPLTPFQQELEHRRVASILLEAVWRNIDTDYKSTYRMEIWRQFEERLTTAARITPNLTSFLSKFAELFRVKELGRDAHHRVQVERILAGAYGDPDTLLYGLRRDPAICVLLLRNRLDEEKVHAGYKEL